jgi:hypothetical protein
MYTVDEQDRVVELEGLPQHETGAPLPHVLAGRELLLWYVIGPDAEEIALVQFSRPYAHYLGSPNDEASDGHPLYARGLYSYGTYEIIGSSWIRLLEHRNRVHPSHKPEHFEGLRHFVFTFHDETFECVARGTELVARLPGNDTSPASVLSRAADYLPWLTAEYRPIRVRPVR